MDPRSWIQFNHSQLPIREIATLFANDGEILAMCHWRRTRQAPTTAGTVTSDLEHGSHQQLDLRASGERGSPSSHIQYRSGIDRVAQVAHNTRVREGASSRNRSSIVPKHAEADNYIESLPNELLENVFLLAISTSFPIEDSSWPLCPMFSRRSYGDRHSPSNSVSGIPEVDAASSRSTSRASQNQQVLDTTLALTNGPHLLPTTLSQTCRRFRAVLRNAPHLWSFINVTRVISTQGHRALKPRQIIGWLPIYLSRSRDAKLHITLDTTKLASFSAPVSHSLAPSSTALIHPDSILALLLSTVQRWASLTILASHVGSQTISPLLHSLSPIQTPSLKHFRIAADIWRPGIVGYGSQPPPLFVGGCPLLESIVLDGIHLDWKSCFSYGSSPETPGLFAHLKSLELRFVGNHFPRFERFTQLLELGAPRLEQLAVRDVLDEALRALDPPPLPYFEDMYEGQPSSPLNQPPLTPDSADLSTGSGTTRSGRSASSRSPIPGHIEGLHLTLPPAAQHYHANQSSAGRGSRGRSYSTSSSSSSSSASSSPPTSPYYQQFARVHRPHRRRPEREFRKINMPLLKHLEVHAYNPSGGTDRRSVASEASRISARRQGGPSNEAPEHTSLTRFLYLLAMPSLQTLGISGLGYAEWIGIADMLGFPRDFEQILSAPSRPHSRKSSDRGSSKESAGGCIREGSRYAPSHASSRHSGREVEGSGRSFPFLKTLKVDLTDR